MKSLCFGICIVVRVCVCVLVTQLCPTICHPMDYSLPGFSVHGILQARILEWIAMPFSRGTSHFRDWTLVSCITSRFFTIWATGKSYCMVGIEQLKDFCDLVVSIFQSSHIPKAHWLSLTNATERILSIFKALKLYFNSERKPPPKSYWLLSNLLREVYLFLITYSFQYLFSNRIMQIKRKANSIIEDSITWRNSLNVLKKNYKKTLSFKC